MAKGHHQIKRKNGSGKVHDITLSRFDWSLYKKSQPIYSPTVSPLDVFADDGVSQPSNSRPAAVAGDGSSGTGDYLADGLAISYIAPSSGALGTHARVQQSPAKTKTRAAAKYTTGMHASPSTAMSICGSSANGSPMPNQTPDLPTSKLAPPETSAAAWNDSAAQESAPNPHEAFFLILERLSARSEKNFERSDELTTQLVEMGIHVDNNGNWSLGDQFVSLHEHLGKYGFDAVIQGYAEHQHQHSAAAEGSADEPDDRELIEQMVVDRQNFRQTKDYAQSDKIQDTLKGKAMMTLICRADSLPYGYQLRHRVLTFQRSMFVVVWPSLHFRNGHRDRQGWELAS